MNGHDITLAGVRLTALPSGALWWAGARSLVVSDLHLGKALRVARLGGALLPPYDSRETLARLAAEIARLDPAEVICLGDSFDDDAAARSLAPSLRSEIARLQAGRRWVWIAGNHDPAPPGLGGTHLAEARRGRLTFRHVARAGAFGEVSGHYHPKAQVDLGGRRISRPCFLADSARIVLPAFGAYTGGLRWTDPALQALMGPGALAVLTGAGCVCLPLPRRRPAGTGR